MRCGHRGVTMMTVDPLTQTRELLEQLKLRDALAVLDEHLSPDAAERNRMLEALSKLLGVEARQRRERRIQRRIDAAKLPEHPTLEAFDFDFQPGIDRGVVMALAAMDWVGRAEDLLLIGQSGVGKSHIGKALCLRACAAEYIVRYVTCADLMTDLVASLATNSLADRLKRYTRPQLLLIDDLGAAVVQGPGCSAREGVDDRDEQPRSRAMGRVPRQQAPDDRVAGPPAVPGDDTVHHGPELSAGPAREAPEEAAASGGEEVGQEGRPAEPREELSPPTTPPIGAGWIRSAADRAA